MSMNVKRALHRWELIVPLTLYIIAAGGLLALTLSGGWHPEPTIFETTRELPPNHRFVADDVIPSGPPHRFLSWSLATVRDFEGRYAKKHFMPRERIDLDQATRKPTLEAPRDTFLFWTPPDSIATADALAADAGATAELCGLDKTERQCFTAVTVAAVSCDGNGKCSAGLWIPRGKRPALLTALDEASRTAAGRRVRVYLRRRPWGSRE